MVSGLHDLDLDDGQSRARPHQVISDKYELLRVMSSGGMGSVWVAHHRALANQVAIKLLHERLTSKELRVRLVMEAQLAARVEHSNIVRVLDLGYTEWKAPYIVMELLDGRDLRSELDCGPMEPVRAVQILLPVLEGLAYAHDRDIVHRDLKPENIFLDGSEGGDYVVPKIIDFGIARCLADSGARRITNSGSVFGTVHYLSTEQALGKDDVDHRADIWGVCAVLYECIVGHAPFGDRDPATALRAIIQEDIPPPSALGVDVGELEAIIMRGLQRDRDLRWPDARTLGQALSRWLLERGVTEDASAHSVRSRWFGSVPDSDSVPPVPSVSPEMTSIQRAREAETLMRSLPRRKVRWVALGFAALFLASGVAYASSSEQVRTLRKVGAIQMRLDQRFARTTVEAVLPAPPVQERTTLSNSRPTKKGTPPATHTNQATRYDPILGF
jgi:serine/threonine-protein kinase